MTDLLLDTTFLIDAERSGDRLSELIGDDDDVAVASEHAKLLAAVRRQGRPRGAHDLIIAATAHATGRVVVTADAAAFNELPDVAIRSHP